MKRIPRFWALFGFIAALVALHPIGQTVLAVEHTDAFIVYPRATRIWSGNVEGWSELTYHVKEAFPASSVIGWISYKLQKQGWRPQTLNRRPDPDGGLKKVQATLVRAVYIPDSDPSPNEHYGNMSAKGDRRNSAQR